MFLGNPFAGASTAPQMLPEPVGALGQLLPPGAGASLLRSVSFFDGAAALRPALVLTTWTTLGLAAILLGDLLKRRPEATRPTTPEPTSTPTSTPAPTPAPVR